MKILFEMGLTLPPVYNRTRCRILPPPAALFHIEGIFVQVFGHTQDRSWSPADFQTGISGIAYWCLPLF
jgi:hypothetical protein